MSAFTKFLNLFKWQPDVDGEEEFDIEKSLNENWDKIDTKLETYMTDLSKEVEDFKNDTDTQVEDIANQVSGLREIAITPTEPTTEEVVWIKKGKNLFNKNSGIVSGSFLGSDGSIGTDTSLFYQNNYIPVLPNTTYTISSSTGESHRIVEYDKDMAFIKRNLNANTSNIYSFTTSSNCYFLRISCNLSNLDSIQLKQGEFTDYEEFIEEKILIKNNAGVFEEYSDVKVGPVMPAQGKVWIKKGKNLVRRLILSDVGNIGPRQVPYLTPSVINRVTIDGLFLEVQENESISININSGYGYAIYFCDEDKKVIYEPGSYEFSSKVQVVPEGMKYLVARIKKEDGTDFTTDDLNNVKFMVAYGTTEYEYEDYIEKEIYVKNDNGVFEKFVSDSQKEIISGSDSNVTINETYIKTLKYANYEKSGSLVHYHFSAITQEISSAINYLVFFENLKYRPINAGIVYLTEQTATQGITNDMIICQTRPNGELRFKTSNAIAEGQYLIFDLMYFTND